MASEETPLLADDAVVDHEAVYNRFSSSHKKIIVAITALTGTFPSKPASLNASLAELHVESRIERHRLLVFTSGSFVPLIPAIARDLDSTGPVVRWVV